MVKPQEVSQGIRDSLSSDGKPEGSKAVDPSAIFFTVGLPCYNRPETTKVAIQSVLAQSHQNFHIIVSDDTSDESTRALVEAFKSPKITYIKNDPPIGLPLKYNELLERTHQGWMVFLGDDDQFHPHFLERVARAISKDPGTVLLHTRAQLFDENEKFLAEDQVPDALLRPEQAIPMLFDYWFKLRVSLTGFVFPVELARQVGGFRDIQKLYFSDTLLWTEIAARGKTRFIAEPLLKLREIRSSLGHDVMDAFTRETEQLLESRGEVADVISRVFDSLKAASTTPQQLLEIEQARAKCLRFLAADSRVFLLSALRRLILKAAGDRNQAVVALVGQIWAKQFPELMTPTFRFLLGAFPWLARVPTALAVPLIRLEQLVEKALRLLYRGGRRSTPTS